MMPKKPLVMSLLFFRTSGIRCFQLMHCKKGHAQNKLTTFRQQHYLLPASDTFFRRRFSSSKMAQAPDEEVVGISPELQSCVSKFVNDGSLSENESKTINNALFLSHYGRNLLDSSGSADEMAEIIKTSIDSYLTQKMKRIETRREPIANVGGYVRSIVKKQIEMMELMQVSSSNNVQRGSSEAANDVPSTSQMKTYTEPGPKAPTEKIDLDMAGVLELLRFNYIEPNELNESCLNALSKHSVAAVKYALETYSKQKKRRELSGMDKIASPSSYVMAVLRNTPAVFTSEQPKPNNQALENELKETSIAIEHVTLEHGKGQSPEGQELSSHQIDTGCQDEQVRELGETIPSSAATSTCEGRHATVTIEYVDKCLACLSKLEQPVKSLPGIGPKTEQALNKLGLFTLRDLMWYFPRSFIDRSVLQRDIRDVADGDLGTFILTIHKDKVTHNAVPCSDEEGNPLNIVFFYGNSRQSTNIVNAEKAKLCKSSVDTMIVSGKVSKHPEKGYTIFNPDVIATVDEAKDVLGIEPVYGVCSGLSQNKLIKAIEGALEVAQELRLLPESLPQDVLDDLNWPTFVDAISIAHKPNTMDDAGVDSPARHRIAFEELCIQQAQLALTRWDLKYSGLDSNINSQTITYESSTWQDSPLVSRAVHSLPFELTRSQTDCLNELWSDAISSNGRMTRLLQGDVGSGKTVLAYLLGLGCIESCQGGGSVVAILAPTQLLALQHFQTLKGFTESYNDKYPDATIKLSVELLTGSIVGSKRNDIYTRLEEADAIFVIGTHALVSSDVIDRLRNLRSSGESKGLALAVVDEEQRFGVQQRRALSSCAANTMFMSATPIPRTVGLSKGSGLLDVTHLESENVRNVETTITTKDNLDKVIGALRTKISRGSKCFWVLPRIGNETDSEDSNCGKSSVLSRYTMLTDILGQDKVGYVHGRMSIKDREEQLARFADASSSVKLLVSTTVIEVGIDIPNVDILIVENADRFGLSALHQLRGRIGRKGSTNLDCHCLLLSEEEHFNTAAGPSSSLKRLDILRETMSGQQVADADFHLRGPGELLGSAQSGIIAGRTIDPDYHWGMLGAATVIGRAFSEVSHMNPNEAFGADSNNNKLVDKLERGELSSFYEQTNASFEKGFLLRFMMSLFGNWSRREDRGSNTVDMIAMLQQLSVVKDEVTDQDMIVHEKIIALISSFTNDANGEAKSEPRLRAERVRPSDIPTAAEKSVLDEPVNSPNKWYSGKPLYVSTNRVDLTGDDVKFVVLDVETTGLSDKSDHVIQIAAKVLGSHDDADLFSEYILPPIDKLPEKIEELTGITDSFLRNGGYDPASGTERVGAARGFEEVFLDFDNWCKDRSQGKALVMVAHNARFDRGMIEGELRRRRSLGGKSSLPLSLSEVFDSSVDSLHLFRDRRMWQSFVAPTSLPRPDSFKLGYIYHHVFGKPISNSHNAVADIQALERLLLNKQQFYGWKSIANEIQTPFSKLI